VKSAGDFACFKNKNAFSFVRARILAEPRQIWLAWGIVGWEEMPPKIAWAEKNLM
jgi:hypothetical protein